jgi:hypothetical protein
MSHREPVKQNRSNSGNTFSLFEEYHAAVNFDQFRSIKFWTRPVVPHLGLAARLVQGSVTPQVVIAIPNHFESSGISVFFGQFPEIPEFFPEFLFTQSICFKTPFTTS